MDLLSGAEGVITGRQIREARRSLLWAQKDLAKRARVPLSVVVRAENSSDEPMVTIVHLNAIVVALRVAGTSFSPIDGGIDVDRDGT